MVVEAQLTNCRGVRRWILGLNGDGFRPHRYDAIHVHRTHSAVWLADSAVSLASFSSASASASAAPRPHHLPFAVNPNPAPLVPSFSSSSPPAFPAPHRLFSSASGSSMVVVGSADSFNSILSKVQDEKLPAVFYYTAVWCGPCRAIAPLVSKLSSQYPKIPVYKVDIDLEGLGNKLHGLNICSVPTFHFYHKGQRIGEIVGADAKKLEAVMESLHKQQ